MIALRNVKRRRGPINLEEEPPGLLEMLESPDPEIRRRVANILDERHRNRVERARGELAC